MNTRPINGWQKFRRWLGHIPPQWLGMIAVLLGAYTALPICLVFFAPELADLAKVWPWSTGVWLVLLYCLSSRE
jgi:hypothetical protein